MEPLVYLDRKTGKEEAELVYGAKALQFLYGNDLLTNILGIPLLHLFIRNPIFSTFYGSWQRSPLSKRKIQPFIKAFQIDSSEFVEPIEKFNSFNDFFVRKLKLETRPKAPGADVAIIPADGRYRFYPKLSESDGFLVKNEKFCLDTLLEDPSLAKKYQHGSMVIARLCPSDYHRYHFPCRCIPSETTLINGWLYSVNPIAIKKNIHIFTLNKRTLCRLVTENFGEILFLEIGATNVGSIHQTYVPGIVHEKGDEKGYFSFGASSLILLFEEGEIMFDEDLLAASARGMEIRCLMGQSMGKALKQSANNGQRM